MVMGDLFSYNLFSPRIIYTSYYRHIYLNNRRKQIMMTLELTLYALGIIGVCFGYLVMREVVMPKFDKWIDEE